jgi:hypothetical protein
MVFSRSEGIAASPLGGAGSSLTILCRIASLESPPNGRRPVTIS